MRWDGWVCSSSRTSTRISHPFSVATSRALSPPPSASLLWTQGIFFENRYIKRCDELERKLRYMKQEIESFGLAMAPVEAVTLDFAAQREGRYVPASPHSKEL